MKNILKKLMSDNNKEKPGLPKAAPYQVVADIKKNYNKTQQTRILELLQQAVSPPSPNPYDKKSIDRKTVV